MKSVSLEIECRAQNEAAYVLGKMLRNGRFSIRRVVWGRLLAREERRPDEVIRRAKVLIVGK